MNAQAKIELDPSLFEMKLRAVPQKQTQTKVVDKDKNKLANKIECRVDSRDMDEVLAMLVPTSELNKHNIGSREDWIESITDRTKNKLTFAANFKDHQVKMKISGKIVASFHDCELTTFSFDLEHTVMKFHILAKGATGESVGKLAEVVDHNVVMEFKRGEHWSVQEEIEREQEEGDAETQTDIADSEEAKAQKAKVERNKDKANKANTDKARGRGTSKNPKAGRS